MVRTVRRVILAGFLATILVAPAYLRAFKIAGASDAPTLLIGDKTLVNRAAYRANFPYTQIEMASIGRPKRGDMVQIVRPDMPGVNLLLKRVLGLPGEIIEIRDHRHCQRTP